MGTPMTRADETRCEIVNLDDVETLDSESSAALLTLATVGATGELTCRCGESDAHIFLQCGRVAWANDCKHQRAFTAYLREKAGVDAAAIEEAVLECRSTRSPIGETLIRLGIATEAQVRAALRHQIHLALHIGECRGEGKTEFQPRNYGTYDVRFTFQVEDLLAEERQAVER
jgi:hypothetical protein